MRFSSSHAGGAVKKGVALSTIPQGARARFVRVDAAQGLRARLAAMGLVPGTEVLMVSNRGGGPAVVEVKGTRLALGRGMTGKIQVRRDGLPCDIER